MGRFSIESLERIKLFRARMFIDIRKYLTLSFFLLLLLSDTSNPLFADDNLGKALIGIGYADVISQFGPPLSKSELEIRRQAIWNYKKQQIKFANGKVIRVKYFEAASSDFNHIGNANIQSVQRPDVEDTIARSTDYQYPSFSVYEVFREINKESIKDVTKSRNPFGSRLSR